MHHVVTKLDARQPGALDLGGWAKELAARCPALLALSIAPYLYLFSSVPPMPDPASIPSPSAAAIQLVLYSKPGCHLCEGLEEKLAAIPAGLFTLEIRDITTKEAWFQAYQYEIPVLCQVVPTSAGVEESPLPRLSPRAPVARVEQMIQTHCNGDGTK